MDPKIRYKCNRCAKQFTHSKAFTSHITRKSPCGILDSVYIYNCKSEKFMYEVDKETIIKLFMQLDAIFNNMTEEDRAKVRSVHDDIITPQFQLSLT